MPKQTRDELIEWLQLLSSLTPVLDDVHRFNTAADMLKQDKADAAAMAALRRIFKHVDEMDGPGGVTMCGSQEGGTVEVYTGADMYGASEFYTEGKWEDALQEAWEEIELAIAEEEEEPAGLTADEQLIAERLRQTDWRIFT